MWVYNTVAAGFGSRKFPSALRRRSPLLPSGMDLYPSHRYTPDRSGLTANPLHFVCRKYRKSLLSTIKVRAGRFQTFHMKSTR